VGEPIRCSFSNLSLKSCCKIGIIDGEVKKFINDHKSVPHIGWNGAVSRCTLSNQSLSASSSFVDFVDSDARYYFVHSYAVTLVSDPSDTSKVIEENHALEWAHTLTTYGDETFVSSVSKGCFHSHSF
jgi:imidazole glycerol-phosphate synthase